MIYLGLFAFLQREVYICCSFISWLLVGGGSRTTMGFLQPFGSAPPGSSGSREPHCCGPKESPDGLGWKDLNILYFIYYNIKFTSFVVAYPILQL